MGAVFVSGGGDAPIELVSDRERFFAKIRDYQHEPELFIDIETADWWTPTPRVALLQVWAGRKSPCSTCWLPAWEKCSRTVLFPTSWRTSESANGRTARRTRGGSLA